MLGKSVAFAATITALALPVAQSPLIDIPAELDHIDWSRTPSSVIQSGQTGQSVVWLGRVKSAVARPENGHVVFEWVCRHLTFAEHGNPIAKQPVRFSASNSGYFVVNLVTEIPAALAESLTPQVRDAGKYILVVGRVQAIVQRGGKTAVFLATSKMLQANEIAEPITK